MSQGRSQVEGAHRSGAPPVCGAPATPAADAGRADGADHPGGSPVEPAQEVPAAIRWPDSFARTESSASFPVAESQG